MTTDPADPSLAPRTATTWQVNVEQFPDEPEPPIIGGPRTVRAARATPMIDVQYDVPVSLDNTIRAGSRYSITITTGYQPGYHSDGEFIMSAWVCHDSGETWTKLGTEQVGQSGQAEFTIRTPRDAEHASVRVVAEDEHGNSGRPDPDQSLEGGFVAPGGSEPKRGWLGDDPVSRPATPASRSAIATGVPT